MKRRVAKPHCPYPLKGEMEENLAKNKKEDYNL